MIERREELGGRAGADPVPEGDVLVREVAVGVGEAEVDVRAPERVELIARGDDAAHDRVERAGVGAVGRVRRDREVDLVGDRQRDDRRVAAERRRRLAHERLPGGHVALLLGRRVVADLGLDLEPLAAVLLGERGEAVDPRSAVGHEQAVEAHHERAPRRLERVQGVERLRRVLGRDLALGSACRAGERGVIPKRSGPGAPSTPAGRRLDRGRAGHEPARGLPARPPPCRGDHESAATTASQHRRIGCHPG